jgi:murein DD-endopeptidase MepM/ murein hydrolase activator NlpD
VPSLVRPLFRALPGILAAICLLAVPSLRAEAPAAGKSAPDAGQVTAVKAKAKPKTKVKSKAKPKAKAKAKPGAKPKAGANRPAGMAWFGARPEVVRDEEVGGGTMRRGCAVTGAGAEGLLTEAGVQDHEFLNALRREVPATVSNLKGCLSYVLTLTRSGVLRAFGLRLPAESGQSDRIVLLSREAPAEPVSAQTEDIGKAVRDLATVSLPLRDFVAHALDFQTPLPAESLHSLHSLVAQMQPKGLEDASEGLVVRAAYDDGDDEETAGRIQSVEILRESTGDVIRQALWVERDGLPGGYFAPDGTSFEHSLWTAPVSFTRISRGIGNFKVTARKPVVKRTAKGGTKVVMTRVTKRGPHVGVDYAAPTGVPVIAVADGKVIEVGPRGGYGNLIIVEHAGGYTTRYAHLSAFSPDVEVGTEVRRGEEIGFVGSTGFSTGPHLHFEIRRNGVYLDPLDQRLNFGLWSMRPADYLPMLKQSLITNASR